MQNSNHGSGTTAIVLALWAPIFLVQEVQPMNQENLAREERDERYEEYVRELKTSATTVVSYDGLLEAVRGYQVTVLGGYSGLGYEHPGVLRERIEEIVQRKGDRSIYVLGGTEVGIGEAYRWIPELARDLGMSEVKTAGIVSRNAAAYGVPDQDYVVFVDTPVDNWEVVVDGGSLMVGIAKQADGELIYFRGGAVSEEEIEEALGLAVPVILYTGEGLAPNAVNVAERLERNPQYVIDGTEGFLARQQSDDRDSSPTVITVDRDGNVVARN